MAGERYNILSGSLLTGLLRFGLPLSMGMGLHALFNVVDMVVVGHLPEGADALSVLAVCDLLAMIPTIMASGIANAAVAVVSRKVGEGNIDRASEACWRSFSVLVVLSVVVGLAGLFLASPIVSLMGVKGWVHDASTNYLQIMLMGSITVFALVHSTSALRGYGHSYTPTLMIFGANLLNLFVAVLLVYGPGDAPAAFSWGPPVAAALGIPRLGVEGAAWATVFSRSVVLVVALGLLAKDFPVHGWRRVCPDWAEVRQLLHIAWPTSAQYGVRVGSILALLAVVGHRFTSESDSSALGAMGVCIRLDTFGLFLGLGWGSAAATFVGQNLGAGQIRRAVKAGWLAGVLNGSMLLLLGVGFAVWARPLVSLFNDSEGVLRISEAYLRIVAPTYLGLGLSMGLATALGGAGETGTGLKVDSLVFLGFQTVLMLVLVTGLGWPLVTCFVLVAASNILTSVLYIGAYRRDYWRHRPLL